ncbi:hypothetical protein [uncultured Brevundimonas sp.]|uniref:hypothetical protein n=1 Tax=uncultured Brevundimonas sp. TaxID=213418 RepID=UPI0030ED9FE0|tara:strand:- start:8055 stop:8594 length:540 start_codon:yes stop_codon:yes gene_type:complete
MTNWIKAANPLATIAGPDEARSAARMSAMALWLSAAWGGVGFVWMMMNLERIQAAMTAAVAVQTEGQSAEAAALANSIIANGAQTGLIFAGIIVVVQLALGWFQWTRPNRYIPIIFLMLSAYALLTDVFGIVSAGGIGVDATAMNPAWRMIVGLVVAAVCTLLHLGGLRGAIKLDKTAG